MRERIKKGDTVIVVDIEDDNWRNSSTLGKTGKVTRIDRPGRGPNIHVQFTDRLGRRYYDTELDVVEK